MIEGFFEDVRACYRDRPVPLPSLSFAAEVHTSQGNQCKAAVMRQGRCDLGTPAAMERATGWTCRSQAAPSIGPMSVGQACERSRGRVSRMPSLGAHWTQASGHQTAFFGLSYRLRFATQALRCIDDRESCCMLAHLIPLNQVEPVF